MRLGLVVSTDEPVERARDACLSEHLERAHAARDAGLDTLAVIHRYSFGPAAAADRDGDPLTTVRFQPLPLLAHLAAVFGDSMHYATSVLLSASAHPVQLAEDVTTLDVLCRGRLRVGIGLGWMPYEFEAFGVEHATRGRRFTELLQLYRMLLEQDHVDFAGEFFTVGGARLLARGHGGRRPPLWVGASSRPAIRRAAEHGDAWLMSAHVPVDDLEDQLGTYRVLRGELGLGPPADVPLVRMISMADDRETALREAEPAIAAWYRARGRWGWFVTAGATGAAVRDEVLRSGRWVIGTPDDCAAQIADLRQRLGVTELLLAMPWPERQPGRRTRTIELIGRELVPRLRASGLLPPTAAA